MKWGSSHERRSVSHGRRSPVLIVLSPYHLTTREPVALASLLLATEVITLLPGRLGGGSRTQMREAKSAAERTPQFRELVQSWAWTEPLWRAGIVSGDFEGEDAIEDVRTAAHAVIRDERFAVLRPLMREDVFTDETHYLRAIASDLMKAGPDPAVSLPVAAGLDRFAGRHHLFAARSGASSVAQQAEAKLGRMIGSIVVPVFVQAAADRILHAREVLQDELDELRAALEDLAESVDAGEDPAEMMIAVTAAATAYAAAFEARRSEIFSLSDEDDVRAVEGSVVVSVMRLPGDAVMQSSLSAIALLGGRGQELGAAAASGLADAESGAIVPMHAQPVTALIIRAMGARPTQRGRRR